MLCLFSLNMGLFISRTDNRSQTHKILATKVVKVMLKTGTLGSFSRTREFYF